MKRLWLSVLALTAVAIGGLQAAPDQRQPTFGALETMSPEAARAQAQAWLQGVGKTDAQTMQQFQAIWKQEERPVLDRLADTFALGSADAARELAAARDPFAPAPTKQPGIIKDASQSQFFRANMALAYARSLSNRRVHEEALAALKAFPPEQVVAPATYLFTRAVCEHALLQKAEATRTITRLIEEGVASPERYKTVSALILLDMQTWKEKDLAAVARKMDISQRRLELARGGPETQKIQKEIIARLDELIKELENKAKKGGS